MGIGIAASVMGLMVSGDVGGITFYTDRYGRKISYPKAPPNKPPTQMQIDARARFRSAQQEYMGLTPQQKKDYEDLVNKANLCMTGQNIFIHVAMRRSFGVLDTIMLQTGVTVVPPTAV